MMTSRFPLFNAQRRSIAVGIWTLLIASIGLIEGQPGFWTALIAISAIASLSALAILLLVQDTSRASRWTPVTIGIAIPFVWALLFATAPADLLLLGLIAAALPAYVGSAFPSHIGTDRMSFEESSVEKQHIEPSTLLDFQTRSLSIDDSANDGEDLESEEVADDEASQNLTHWMKRLLSDGGDLMEGGLRVEFAEGQREITVHVSFCPPFQSIPDITTEDLNGDDIEIRVAAAFPFGMRLTVRRPAAAGGKSKVLPRSSSQVGFVAISHTVRRVA